MSNIKLPAEYFKGNGITAQKAQISRQRIIEIINEAIEADRQARGGDQTKHKQPETRVNTGLGGGDQRAEFEAWLRVKPCGAAHDFAWEAWQAAVKAALASPEIQALRKDAQRYRFIRPGDAMVWCSSGDYPIENENLDAAIDAAIEEQNDCMP